MKSNESSIKSEIKYGVGGPKLLGSKDGDRIVVSSVFIRLFSSFERN